MPLLRALTTGLPRSQLTKELFTSAYLVIACGLVAQSQQASSPQSLRWSHGGMATVLSTSAGVQAASQHCEP